MILVDANLIITFQRTKDAKLDSLFRSLPVEVCGVTRAEVLHGARNPAERQQLLIVLNAFAGLVTPESCWDMVGDHLAALRAAGLSVPFADVILATVALAHDVELWSRDQHFALMQKVLPALKLFQEPP